VENFSKAKAAAVRAIELDDSLAWGHAEFARAVLSLDWDWATAEREYKRAIELNPNGFHAGYAWYLVRTGRQAEAISQVQQLLELDPLSLSPHHMAGMVDMFARQYDQALEQFRMVAELDPSATEPFYRGWIYREKGMYEKAVREFQKMGDHPYGLAHLGNAYARAGRATEARRVISKLERRVPRENVTYGIALVYAGLGEKDKAFAWLEKSYEVRDKGLTYLKVDPCLDPLRSDPRFEDLLRRVGLPP
jgi:tetratricopeptide (TPR) repeat protein